MKQPIYRKPSTSPITLVQEMFIAAEAKGVSLDDIADATGYSKNTICELRRPRGIRGRNPSFALVRDIAQVLGYECRLAPMGWHGKEAGD